MCDSVITTLERERERERERSKSHRIRRQAYTYFTWHCNLYLSRVSNLILTDIWIGQHCPSDNITSHTHSTHILALSLCCVQFVLFSPYFSLSENIKYWQGDMESQTNCTNCAKILSTCTCTATVVVSLHKPEALLAPLQGLARSEAFLLVDLNHAQSKEKWFDTPPVLTAGGVWLWTPWHGDRVSH